MGAVAEFDVGHKSFFQIRRTSHRLGFYFIFSYFFQRTYNEFLYFDRASEDTFLQLLRVIDWMHVFYFIVINGVDVFNNCCFEGLEDSVVHLKDLSHRFITLFLWEPFQLGES